MYVISILFSKHHWEGREWSLQTKLVIMLASTNSLYCMIRAGGWIRREREGNPWRRSVQFIPRVSGYRNEDFLIRRRVRAHLPPRLARPRQSQQDNRHPRVHVFPQPAPLPQDPPVRLSLKCTEEPLPPDEALQKHTHLSLMFLITHKYNHVTQELLFK